MENASKALLIAGAILLCILIIAIGMFIYNGAQSTITSSMTSLKSHEIESFNNQFTMYEGKQKGTAIKNLISKLITNATANKEEYKTKIPGIFLYYDYMTDEHPFNYIFSSNPNRLEDVEKYYMTDIGYVRSWVKPNHEYFVYITYQKNGLIDTFTVFYENHYPTYIWAVPHKRIPYVE